MLFDGAVEEAEERFLRRLLHPLWDAGFVVGHQVRDAAELAELEVDNPEFLLALTDARLVTGDAALFERLRESFHVPRTHAHVLGALQSLIDARHAQFNATLYQLEPDVKDAPGRPARHRRGPHGRRGDRSLSPAARRRRPGAC